MADNPTFSTPEAMAKTIKSKYPVYAKISDHDLVQKVLTKYPQYWDHVNRQSFEKGGFAPAGKPAEETPKSQAPMAEIRAYNPTWWERAKNVFGTRGAAGAVQQFQRAHEATGDLTAALHSFVQAPLANFEELFPANPKSTAGQVSKGAARAASGFTTPSQMALMAVPAAKAVEGFEFLPQVFHAIGTAMMPTMAMGVYDSAKQIKDAKQSGDKEAENEAWGEMGANLASVVVPHFGGKLAERFSANTEKLNSSADSLYSKKFTELDQNEKAHVLYGQIEDASPKFKARVAQEVERLNKKRGKKSAEDQDIVEQARQQGVAPATILSQEETQRKIQAAKQVVNQVLTRRSREQAFREHSAQMEAEARRRQYEHDKAADQPPVEGQSRAEQRGFAVEDSRHIELGENARETMLDEAGQRKTSTEAEPIEPPKVDDRRFWIGDRTLTPARAPEAEKPVQEFAEQRTGASFSELPAARQRVIARYFERYQPEQWKSFQSTPAFASFQNRLRTMADADAVWKRYLDRNDSGDNVALNPGADLHAGLSRLILNRTKVETALQADPETHRALNESAEKSMGYSFDALRGEDRVSALAEYLREKPDKVGAFLTPDLTQRIQSGQHIDLANMDATLRDRQQAEVLMSHRDAIKREMDAATAQRMVLEERQKHDSEISGVLTAEPVEAASRGLTGMAEKLNLGPVGSADDLFRIEQEARRLPRTERTPDLTQFMTRMRQVRVAAEDHILRDLAESTAAQFRADRETAQESSVREVVKFSTQAEDLDRVADHLAKGDSEQRAEAQTVRETASFVQRKADAITAGAESVLKPSQPVTRPNVPMTAGRETRVVTPGNSEGIPAHYALLDARDLQTSHLPLSYEHRPGYNQTGQPRDYSTNQNAQAAVESRAANLDVDQLLSSGVTTMEGPAVVDQKLHVISGNGRMLSVLTSLERKPEEFHGYAQALRERLAGFGIDPNELAKYRNPVLVKVLDTPIASETEWARMGVEMNRDPMLGLSESEQGVAMARMLAPEYQQRLAKIIDTLPLVDDEGRALTVREALRKKSADIAKLMQDAGVISANKAQEFLTSDGELKDKAKDLFEHMLAGLTVTDSAVLERASASTKDKLARAGLFFVRMKAAGEDWNLASMNTDAVDLLTRAQNRAAELRKLEALDDKVEHSLLDRMLHPEKYRQSNFEMQFDGQPVHPPVHPAVEGLARALEEPPKTYTSMIAKYADAAEGIQDSMFGAEHPAYVFNREIGKHYDVAVDPDEWGMVNGLPEAMKESIEQGRDPLPVEPEVHAETVIQDLHPDSSSVTEALKSGPRTVAGLKEALASHPGMTPEMAEALPEMFENILPRAIGQSLEELLGNRRLSIAVGGKDGQARGYMEMVEDGKAIISLCDSADTSTFLHEMAHYIRHYLSPEDQGVANKFVGAKPGTDWNDTQEEQFAQAFERYHHDGGIRRGALEKVFSTIHRAMQSVYNAVTGRNLAKGSPELNAMFDKWYDWQRSERKPITKRLDVDALEEAAAGRVRIPEDARRVEGRGHTSDAAQAFIFLGKEDAAAFLRDKKNGVRAWEMYQVKGEDAVYVKADLKKGRRLHQAALGDAVSLARHARDLEAQLKKTADPREQARLRGLLNGVEDKLRGSTYVLGGKADPPDTSARQLIYGVSEHPSVNEPTTPAQAATVQQSMGDPTALSLGGEHGTKRAVPDEASRVREEGGSDRVPEPKVPANGQHGAIAKPDKHPLADVKAAKLKASDRQRGTPVVDPDTWRGHVEALGLPDGTPPPTLRISPQVRELMIYPGQAEAIEGALSALQQYDGTVLAAPTGSGKTVMLSVIADHLLGTGGDKVGLIVTRSQNLIHEADGYVEWGRKVGLTVDSLPPKAQEIQSGGVYAATYAQIRGARDVFSVPWDFVLFDEAAEARNWTDSEQGKAVVLLGHAANKVVYASATPYHTVMELGYMHKLGMWPQGGFTQWAEQFGLREIAPNTYTGGTSAGKLEKLRQQLIERGQWQTLYKDMDGVEAHVAMVPQTPEVKEGVRSIRSAFAMAAKAFEKAGMSRYLTPTAGHEAIYLKRFIEGARLPRAIELAKQAMDKGWKPVMFSEYRSGSDTGMDFFHNLPGELGKTINAMLPPLPDVVAEMRKAFGDKIGIFAGDANQLRAGELEQFMGGNKDAIYMTYSAGAVGANAQDKLGDRPRMGIFLGLPWSGIMFEQGTGRTWRYGTKSDTANIFMTSDALPEMKVLATKILPRMRALRAAVYGEKIEAQLSKDLRESVGIPEEMLQYEQGDEVKTDAAQFEQEGNGARYAHIDELEMPDAKKAMNKGMKYKGRGRLYQGPVEDDPFQKAAQEAWAELLKRTKDHSAPQAAAVTQNEGLIRLEAAAAGHSAMGSGEAVAAAVNRRTLDMGNDALIWLDDLKDSGRTGSQFVKSSVWMFGTSGDRAVEKVFQAAKMPAEGAEMKRRIVDYDIRSGNYRAELGGMVAKIIHENHIRPGDHEMVTRVIEGTATSDDPRITKAAEEYRRFFSHIRKRLADAGLVVSIYEDGKRKDIPYSAISDDPHYWPRIYDWNKKIVLSDPKTGEKTVTSLGKVMDMPTSDERREQLIEKIAQQRGISKVQAQAFFDKRARGVRLAGNVERAREFDIPMYGRDRRAVERYVNEVAEKIAAAEVHGQFREKTNDFINRLPNEQMRKLVDHIVTADLDPARLHDEDRAALRVANRALVLSKMTLSFLKVGFHQVKASMATNTRSVARALVEGAVHPRDVYQNAQDCGALVNYMRTAWMREYGMKVGGIDQKMLDFTGFTPLMYFTRMTSAAAGRLWLEKYAYPELVKDPKNPVLRRKLADLYGYTDEQMDRLATQGYGPEDVKRVSLAAANWTTGSGRPSELPAALRGSAGDGPIYSRLVTVMRIAQSLHGFMFKTANLVNRTVWHELYQSDWKTPAPYHLIGRFAVNFGLAGWALNEMLYLRHQMSGSNEAQIEKRRRDWLEEHPASKEALFYAMTDISMGMGTEVLTQFFESMATHDPKDRQKMAQQHRVRNAAGELIFGTAGSSMWDAATAVGDYAETFRDTGNHRLAPDERRKKILEQLANEEVPVTRLALKPHAAPSTPLSSLHRHRRKRASGLLK